jgi:hypothetical protein
LVLQMYVSTLPWYFTVLEKYSCEAWGPSRIPVGFHTRPTVETRASTCARYAKPKTDTSSGNRTQDLQNRIRRTTSPTAEPKLSQSVYQQRCEGESRPFRYMLSLSVDHLLVLTRYRYIGWHFVFFCEANISTMHSKKRPPCGFSPICRCTAIHTPNWRGAEFDLESGY